MSQLSILIVDDDQDFRESLGAVLKRRGYQVEMAESTAEALRCVRDHPVSLALVDVMMPDMDGIACLNQLLDAAPSVQVLLMTGFAVDERIREGLRCGAAQVIRKPIDVAKLIARLEHRCSAPTVLLGMGETQLLRTLKAALENQGLDVRAATSPDALAELLGDAPDTRVAVLDLALLQQLADGRARALEGQTGPRRILLLNGRAHLLAELLESVPENLRVHEGPATPETLLNEVTEMLRSAGE